MSQGIVKGWENIDFGEAFFTAAVYGFAAFYTSKHFDPKYASFANVTEKEEIFIGNIHSVLSNIFTFFKDIFANIINKTVKKVSNSTSNKTTPAPATATSESNSGGSDLSQLAQSMGSMLANASKKGILSQLFYGFKPNFI